MTQRTLSEQRALMESYDDAPPALRDLLKEFDWDEIIKAGTAIDSGDYEAIGRFLRGSLRMVEKIKIRQGEQHLKSGKRVIR